MSKREIERQRGLVNRLRDELADAAGHGLVDAYDRERDRLMDLLEQDR